MWITGSSEIEASWIVNIRNETSGKQLGQFKWNICWHTFLSKLNFPCKTCYYMALHVMPGTRSIGTSIYSVLQI